MAGPDPSLLSQPANAINKALGKENLTPDQIDLYEINEAFASVAIQSMRELEIGADFVNVNVRHLHGSSGRRVRCPDRSAPRAELKRRGGGEGRPGSAAARAGRGL